MNIFVFICLLAGWCGVKEGRRKWNKCMWFDCLAL